ncbi:hypothetical protein EYF80_037931 [Liparis tanakae]|uniref:Uncharacterized protein n=1 Tax=Liparis tanakae TaxID=230148 RepID=A0A4Z2GF85_9TELE|nr:hypothetical protein EYF80_037931 [Liparis tanakae]
MLALIRLPDSAERTFAAKRDAAGGGRPARSKMPPASGLLSLRSPHHLLFPDNRPPRLALSTQPLRLCAEHSAGPASPLCGLIPNKAAVTLRGALSVTSVLSALWEQLRSVSVRRAAGRISSGSADTSRYGGRDEEREIPSLSSSIPPPPALSCSLR